MRILVYSPAFLPLVGGLEIATAQLADKLTGMGHEVVVVSTTAAKGTDELPYRVARRPSPRELLRWVRWCDVVLQQNVSLKGLWPLALVRRPLVVTHHSWYRQPDGTLSWRDRLKRWVARRAEASIAVSAAMAADLGEGTVVIPNSYRSDLFRRLPGVERDSDLLFAGRLVSDKGADVLLAALALLRDDGVTPGLEIVGDGPERRALEEQARALGLSRVVFRGTLSGEELARAMNRHRVVVVPSRYAEPFGIVALEAIACGCLVVGSAAGGLPEAIGPCGLTFPNGDERALARGIAEALAAPPADPDVVRRHLERHAPETQAVRHLALLERAVASRAATRERQVPT